MGIILAIIAAALVVTLIVLVDIACMIDRRP